ncbi:MAG: HigA family addiction module antidote protein [Fibrobacteria bacterium]|nr:HigA family addiction module antidote protein [Fibrobacteria bacterium]
MLKAPTPGEILLEEFIKPMGLSQYRLAKELHVSQMKISEIVNDKRSITANTALRLGKFFGMDPQFWMNLQGLYELRKEKREIGKELNKKIKPHSKAA